MAVAETRAVIPLLFIEKMHSFAATRFSVIGHWDVASDRIGRRSALWPACSASWRGVSP